MKSNEYKIYAKELEDFVNQMFKTYDKTSLLRELDLVQKFESQEKKFFQTAKWVKLPKDFFIAPHGIAIDNSVISADFARAIVNGERNFLLKSILESDVPKHEIESFNYDEFVDIVSKMDNPTDVFIPLDPFFHFVYSWAYESRKSIKFEAGKEPLLLDGDQKIRVHWITSDTDIKKIIVLDKTKIKIIQKTFEQSNAPKEIKPIKEFEHYSKNKNLMLYFGEKEKGFFDFIFKTVISKPELKEDSAIIIDVKNKPKSNVI